MTLAALSGMAFGQVLERMSSPEIEDALQVSLATVKAMEQEDTDDIQQCGFVQELNSYRQATAPQTSSLTQQIFEKLFPYGPAVNALLATLYISGPPSEHSEK